MVFFVKVREEFAREHHEVDVLVDDHAGGVVVGEEGVDGPAETLVELFCPGQVAGGQIDENLGGHALLLCHRGWGGMLPAFCDANILAKSK